MTSLLMRDQYDFAKGIRGKYAGKVVQPRALQTSPRRIWKNSSVHLLAQGRDPIETIREAARKLVLEAIDAHVLSVPVDPFKLAALRSIKVIPRQDIREAQTVAGPDNLPVIEYNPNRPKGRIRFSICHELGHTLFPDCLEQVRHRGFHTHVSSSEHELEVLCNIAAAELLMPIGSMQEELSESDLNIDIAVKMRERYEASVEAVLLRFVSLSPSPYAAFAAVVDESQGLENVRYRLDYVKSTPNWGVGLKSGDLLPSDTIVQQCKVIGFTAKSSNELWIEGAEPLRVEAIGTKPYLEERILPRVIGIVRPASSIAVPRPLFETLQGDALEPRGDGKKIIAHIVNDKTPNWGAGFGRAIGSRWPAAQSHFRTVMESSKGPKLGLTSMSRVEDSVYTFQMVCQRGYGPSPTPRLRYEALRECLAELGDIAERENATVHMPKIGTGEAGGSWGLISNLIAEEVCAKGVSVTVYVPPVTNPARKRQQGGLFDE
jgi:Zn-dependent peptidase ImmA (M78 family)